MKAGKEKDKWAKLGKKKDQGIKKGRGGNS